MTVFACDRISVRVDETHSVSALLHLPPTSSACFVFAHGAGAGMSHSFMEAAAQGLASRDIATLRYQFPFMQQGSKRPDSPALARATVRAAVEEALFRAPSLPLIAGGKSFGARMTSQAQAESPLRGVLGLAFLGFPLHPTDRPSIDRASHLGGVACPMLFVQGTRDKLADLLLLGSVVQSLGPRATLELLQDADHSFHVPVRSGQKDDEVLNQALDRFAQWVGIVSHRP